MSEALLPTAYYRLPRSRGFTLVEVIIAAAIFAVLSLAVYHGYATSIAVSTSSRAMIAATALANEQIEQARNLPYASVGIVNGIPVGEIVREQFLTRDSIPFAVTTAVRNIDDLFDGTLSGTPNDTAPADYKLMEVTIRCASCKNYIPVVLTTTIAPKNLEGATANGALFISVRDAAGVAVPQAVIRIQNTNSAIDITETTDAQGMYKLIDVPPGNLAYTITATKAGYSTDSTTAATPANPDPIVPPATVASGQVTQLTFFIDRIGSLILSTRSIDCSVRATTGITLRGQKIVGGQASSSPVYKYKANMVTDAAGTAVATPMEWDTYSVLPNDSTQHIAGTLPPLGYALAPGATGDLQLLMQQKQGVGLLTLVKDAGTAQPIGGATLVLTRPNFSQTLLSTSPAATGCAPAGQVFFTGLSMTGAPYTLTITHPSYQTLVTEDVRLASEWQDRELVLTPN